MLTQLNFDFKAIGFDKEEEHNHINDEAVWLHALLRVRDTIFFFSLLVTFNILIPLAATDPMSTFGALSHAPTPLFGLNDPTSSINPSNSHLPAHTTSNDSSLQHTKSPIVTGTSVLAIKYADGVMLSADTLCSYGSMAKYKDARRIRPANSHTLIGAGGEYSDFQSIMDMLKNVEQGDINLDDGGTKTPKELWSLMRAIMYQRRNKMNPYWNELVIGGYDEKLGGSFLGFVDKIGTAFEDNMIATGFGAHLALPIMRDRWRPDMAEGEARKLLEDCMRVLFYRDCRALNKIQIAKATKEGNLVSEPYEIETSWDAKSFVGSKAGVEGGNDGGW